MAYLVMFWLEQAADESDRVSFSKRLSIKEHMNKFHQSYSCVFYATSFTKAYPAYSSAACSNQNIIGYTICKEFPTLNATLYYTCNRAKSTIYVVFVDAPPDSDGWVSWGINPTDMGMLGGSYCHVLEGQCYVY
jgi:hypothetical protein